MTIELIDGTRAGQRVYLRRISGQMCGVYNILSGLSGQTIRGYTIGDRIGSGGYGEVYRATQLSVDREVAIKVILPQYANDPMFVADFEAEAKLVAQLEHTNIVPLHNYWHDEQGAFLVMRYVRGGNLKEMIEKQGALPLPRIMLLTEQIAEALAAAHDVGVVHRDLKPENVLIDQRGNAYLTDFGIAKQLTGDEASSESGAVKGTFAYMSPEQIQGETVSPQTDIYALGVMLHEMFTGRHPFADAPVGILLLKHLREPLPDIHEIRDDLPLGIDDVIQKATVKLPADRYASVLQLVNALKSATSDAPSLPSHPAATEKKRPATLEERNRDAMLTNVRKLWVEGVLENSLHNVAMIDLGLKPSWGVVNNPWDTLIRTSSGKDTPTNKSILSIFDQMNGKLLILGDPGSGKTTTLLALARDLLDRADRDEQHPIPVVFNLSSWGESQLPLTEWLVEELNRVYLVPRNVGRDWVNSDMLLLLLDGLDEVTLNVRDACVAAINTFRREHGFVDLVVCSRIADYETLGTQLIMYGAVVIQPLNQEQIESYFLSRGAQFRPIVQMINENDTLLELCQSPLMLSIIVLTYNDSNAALPEGMDVDTLRGVIFDAYVERAFHRGSRNSVYPTNFVRRQLSWLARQMQDHGKSIFQIEYLQPTWLEQDRFHQFAKFYAGASIFLTYTIWAVATVFYLLPNGLIPGELIMRSLLGGLMGVGFGFALSNKAYSRWWMHVIVGVFMLVGLVGRGETLSTALLAAIGFSVFYAFTLNIFKSEEYSPGSISPVESLSFSWVDLPYIPVLVSSPIITFVIINSQAPYQHPERVFLAYFATLPLTLVVVTIVAGLKKNTVGDSSHPNQGIFSSIKYGLLMGAATSAGYFLVVFVSQIIVHDINRALVWGVFSVMWFFWWIAFMVGLATALQHLILRWMLNRDNGIPWNYAALLDHATRLILLRRVGGSYTFIHRYLLEYFAALEP
ncbi:MAG: protein kinase, partial [Chloroflexi bacterium]|nr:protein kinase [Chloroflexota bacterium]